jgi:four helix bundle protein
VKICFDHEKLVAYQLSIELVGWVTDILEAVPKSLAVHDRLDRASTSIPLNIAEGNGKFTPPDRCRYFDNARGSALECAAALDVLVAKRKATSAQIEKGKELLHRIVSTLVGLIRSNSPDRLHEESVPYRVGNEEAK